VTSVLTQQEYFPGNAMGAASHSARIEVQGVHKSFGTKSVLRDLDLTIEPGEFVAIVGRSGCGKSTLLRLLAGLDTPTAGRVLVDGKPLKGLNTDARVMFQDARLMPWMRVVNNVGLGLNGAWQERAISALADVGLEDRKGDWPAILSGGQRQRVALARALVNQPRFMLLDEPLGALDALTRLDMQALLERLWRERQFTALLITHDVDEAVTLADRIILIEDGKIGLDLRVPLRRPRTHGEPEFISLRQQVLQRVMEG